MDTQPQETQPSYLVARLNARIQPVHRGELFEDPLIERLEAESVGHVSGGGTGQNPDGEIAFCDIEIAVPGASSEAQDRVIEWLERLGAPKGSTLMITEENREVPFGILEGLALYLNGTDLPDEVYEQYDSNVVYREINQLIEGVGAIFSYWQGPTETALYLYGDSFTEMHGKIADFVSSYPLCQGSRIVQIA